MIGGVDPDLLSGLALLIGGSLVLVLLAFRRLSLARAARWDVPEGLIALGLMLWLSSAGSGVAVLLRTGSLESGPPTLAEAVLASAVGGLSAATYALARAWRGGSLRALGLVGAPGSVWLAALGLAPAFLLLSAAWHLLIQSLGAPTGPQRVLEGVLAEPDSAVAWATITYGVLIAPLVEELLFRGFLLPPLTRRLGRSLAVVLTALLFGLLHLSDPASVPPLVAFGLALGGLRQWSGSLGPSVLLHALNNAAAFGLALWG